MSAARLPLDGVLVADFSRVLAGPLATAWMADLGAEVIKVERPGVGDDTRQWGPPFTESGSTYFQCANRSKRSVTLDVADPTDQRLAVELARRADVLVENFRVGTLDRYGLGFEHLHAVNPRLVYCSISGFGSGAGAALPGYDFLVQAMGGLMSITGHPDGEPTKVGVAMVDVLTAKDAFAGILAALRVAERDGVGQHLEVNLLSSLLGSLANQASSFLGTGVAPGRLGNAHPSITPYETLTCADGALAVAVGNDGQFARFATVLGCADLAQDGRFATNPARVAHRDTLRGLLEEALAAHDVATWVGRLTEVGVPAGAVGDVASGFSLAESLGLEPVVPVGEAYAGQVRNPIRFHATPVTEYRPPPALGEHDGEIRAWLAT